MYRVFVILFHFEGHDGVFRYFAVYCTPVFGFRDASLGSGNSHFSLPRFLDDNDHGPTENGE